MSNRLSSGLGTRTDDSVQSYASLGERHIDLGPRERQNAFLSVAEGELVLVTRNLRSDSDCPVNETVLIARDKLQDLLAAPHARAVDVECVVAAVREDAPVFSISASSISFAPSACVSYDAVRTIGRCGQWIWYVLCSVRTDSVLRHLALIHIPRRLTRAGEPPKRRERRHRSLEDFAVRCP
jgi:hypothetical protein